MQQKTLVLAAISLAMPIVSVAADAESTAPPDQIIVSGSRAPISIRRLGSSVTVISRDDIERREARNVAELLRSVPGFAVSHTGVTGSQAQVRVRGAEANHVLVLIDGIRANDPATGDEFRWEFLSTGNIERIEIVRGPQSSLWGSDAVSAVIHVITRHGVNGGDAGAYVESGSFRTLNGGIRGSHGGNDWSVSAGIESQHTDGANISRSGEESDDAELSTATLSAGLSLNSSVALRSDLRAVDARSQYDPVDFFTTGLPVDGDVATDTRNLTASLGADIGKAEDTVRHHLDVRYFDSDNRNLTDGTEDSSTASDRTTLAYQATFSIGESRASLGAEHERTRFEQRGAVLFGDPNHDQKMDTTSFMAEYQGLGPKLSWIVSARFDSNSDFDDAVNGRLALSYSLSDTTALRGSVGTGRKNPTFIERFGFFPGQFIGNPDLKPERSVSWELGARTELADGAATLDVVVFRQNLRDEIDGFVFDPVTFLTTAENMPGRSRRSGVETSLQWRLSEALALSGHYTYTDSTEPGPDGRTRELRRPQHTGGVGADLRRTDGRLSATLTADFGGQRADTFFPPWPEPPQRVTLDSHWLVDLVIRYRASEALTIFARGSNLLDDDYEHVYGYRTLGRTGFLGVRMNFGQ